VNAATLIAVAVSLLTLGYTVRATRQTRAEAAQRAEQAEEELVAAIDNLYSPEGRRS
jgi:hypothetical protein